MQDQFLPIFGEVSIRFYSVATLSSFLFFSYPFPDISLIFLLRLSRHLNAQESGEEEGRGAGKYKEMKFIDKVSVRRQRSIAACLKTEAVATLGKKKRQKICAKAPT